MQALLRFLAGVALFGIPTSLSLAAGKLPGQLDTKLTAEEVAREQEDEKRFPNVMRFIHSINVPAGVVKSDPRNAAWIHTSHVFQPQQAMWNGFWKAAAQDKITCLRAFALIARNIKKHGMVVFGPGKDFENSVVENHVDLGLAMPATHIGTGIWSPDPTNPDPDFLLHLKIFYTEQFIHRFPDHILEANLKIGYGPEETYWMDGREYRQHTVDTDIYYGKSGIGFKNVRGIGGQKRGFMGVLQTVLFFIPDAISAMLILEDKNQLLTVASLNTKVDHFETNPIYSVKIVP